MKKEKLVAGLLASASVLGIALAGVTSVDAAPKSGGVTDGSIGFSGHEQPVLNGDLDLLWYPKSFNFGASHDNTTAAKTYTAQNGETKYAIVGDNRVANGTTGSPNAWKLVATASTLADGGATLTGAVYSFTGNELKNYVSASGQDTETPEATGAIDNALPGGHTVSASADVTLPADGTTAVDVMSASAGTIDGKYAAELNDISLTVPANTSQEGKQYAGTVTWSLDDTL